MGMIHSAVLYIGLSVPSVSRRMGCWARSHLLECWLGQRLSVSLGEWHQCAPVSLLICETGVIVLCHFYADHMGVEFSHENF